MKKLISSFLIFFFLLSSALGTSVDYLESLIGKDIVIILKGEYSIRGIVKEILKEETYTKYKKTEIEEKDKRKNKNEIAQLFSSIVVLETFYNKDIRNHSIIYLDSKDISYIIEK